jgi:hypothetical protein
MIELDYRVSQELFNRDCIPPRDRAICEIVWKMVLVAGNPVVFHDGREFPLPPRDTLPEPEGATNGNDRYMLHIGKQILPEIEQAVNDYRLIPPRYSTDIDYAWEVADEMRRRGFQMTLTGYPEKFPENGWWCSFDPPFSSSHAYQAQNIETAPEAICRAALATQERSTNAVCH